MDPRYSKALQSSAPFRRRWYAYAIPAVLVVYLLLPHAEDASHWVRSTGELAPVLPNRKPIKLDSILMKPTEVSLILKYLKRNVSTYLEWGSGGSTMNFPQYVSELVVSIEHDAAWCAKMRAEVRDVKRPKIEVRCVPVHRGTMGWGKKSPFEEGDYRVFRKYIDEVDALEQRTWDFVLIDGRARVDAAIKALSHIRNNSVVVLHDSWRARWKYGEVYDYYDVLEETLSIWNQGCMVLRRKPRFAHFERKPRLAQDILNRKYNL